MLGIYEACKAYGDKRRQNFKECQNPLDIYVVPCPMCYAKIHNLFMKIPIDVLTNDKPKANFDLLYDVQI